MTVKTIAELIASAAADIDDNVTGDILEVHVRSLFQNVVDTFGQNYIVRLSNYATLADALAESKTVFVDANKTINNFQPSNDVTLITGGGLLTLTGTTNLGCLIVGDKQIIEVDSAYWLTCRYNNSKPINPRWFGVKFDGSNASAAANRIGWLTTYHFSRFQSYTYGGNIVEFAGGSFFMSPIDELDMLAEAGDVEWQGSGSFIVLETGSDAPLLSFRNDYYFKETGWSNLKFNGNKGVNTYTSLETPLVWLTSYSMHIENMEIQDSPGDGMRLYQGQHYNLNKCMFKQCRGYGLTIENPLIMSATALDVEYGEEGGLRIIGGSRREAQSIHIDGFYTEGIPLGKPGVHLIGCRNVTIDNWWGVGNVLMEAEDVSGTLYYARNNRVDCTALTGDVHINKGCRNNVIYRDRGKIDNCKVYDLDGRNWILNHPHVNVGGEYLRPLGMVGNAAAPLILDTVWTENGTGNPSVDTMTTHDVLTPSGNDALQIENSQASLPAGTYYWQLIAEADHNIDGWMVLYNSTLAKFWDFNTGDWETSAGDQLWRPPLMNFPQMFQVKFVQPSTGTVLLRIACRNWSTGESMRCYYNGLSTTKDAKLYERIAGVTQ